MDEEKKISLFLQANGWVPYREEDGDYTSFAKDGSAGIDVGCNEVVFIDDTGDFAHIPLNFYAVVGFVYAQRLLLPVIPDSI